MCVENVNSAKFRVFDNKFGDNVKTLRYFLSEIQHRIDFVVNHCFVKFLVFVVSYFFAPTLYNLLPKTTFDVENPSKPIYIEGTDVKTRKNTSL